MGRYRLVGKIIILFLWDEHAKTFPHSLVKYNFSIHDVVRGISILDEKELKSFSQHPKHLCRYVNCSFGTVQKRLKTFILVVVYFLLQLSPFHILIVVESKYFFSGSLLKYSSSSTTVIFHSSTCFFENGLLFIQIMFNTRKYLRIPALEAFLVLQLVL